MLRFFGPLSFSFMLLASTAQAMESNQPANPDNSNEVSPTLEAQSQADLIAYFHALMAQQAAAYDPYEGLPPFEKEVRKVMDLPAESEQKKAGIVGLIVRDDLNASYEEKVNSIVGCFPSFRTPNSSFSELQCIELSSALAQQDPIQFFNMCVSPVYGMNGPSVMEFMNQDVKGSIITKISNDHFEDLFNSQSGMEDRLKILSHMVKLGKTEIVTCVFNKYLDLKNQYNAPYLPTSFRFIDTDQDFIAEFYALTLAPRVPAILMDETLHLDLKGRIAFANRSQFDAIAGIRGRGGYLDKHETSQSLIDFYKFAATCKDPILTINERFNALKQVFVLSEGKEKQVILDALQIEETPFTLKHKLAHFAKAQTDQDLHETGASFILNHQEEINKEANGLYNQLSVHSRMGIPALRQEGATGKGITVAVCDNGFSKILPQESDEKAYMWKILHQGQMQAQQIFDSNFGENYVSSPYHGSQMTDLILTVAGEAQVKPVAVDVNSSENISKAFNFLAEDSSVNIINCSFVLPTQSGSLENQLKDSLLNCLKRNKIVVLASGNHGAYIPSADSDEKPMRVNHRSMDFSDIMDLARMNDGLRAIYNLLHEEGEYSPVFSNLILVGSSKVASLELHEKSVKPGNGPAQKRFVYADADELIGFFDDEPCWGGTSAATAIVSGMLADLWNKVQNPDENTAARVSRALLENTDIDESIPLKTRGLGKINAEKVLENLEKY